MKNLTHSLAAKITAVFLITLTAIVTFIMGLIIAADIYTGAYTGTLKDVRERVMDDYIPGIAQNIASYYYNGEEPFEAAGDVNYYYTISDSEGRLLKSNYEGQKTQYSASVSCGFNYKPIFSNNGIIIEYVPTVEYKVTVYIKDDLVSNDRMSTALYWMGIAYSWRYAAIFIGGAGLLVFFILLVFLFCAAGYRKGAEEPALNKADKLPFDVYTALIIIVFFIEIVIMQGIYDNYALIGAGIVFAIADFLLLLMYLLSMATRIKVGGLLKNTLIFFILRFIWRCLRKTARGLAYILKSISLVWKAVLIILGLSFIELIVMALTGWEPELIFVWWFIEKLILTPFILMLVISLKKLQKGGLTIAAGDLNYKVDTSHMFWDFKRYGEALNSINRGMSRVVEERMKSERLKTELITNVSHDIKTPLTSIINYVDLIKKEKPENERVGEYLEVLDRQSKRLKKLIEDLVEASKASTGNLAVNFTPCEIGVLLDQTVGEYEERLAQNGLELILAKPQEPVMIVADGRHLWRIFDNLMNNICKYTQPSTRVYLTLEKQGGRALITFRNISRYQLNINGEELMERFVRGDSSRSTEGSGLGLAIAKSLTELQKGSLDLTIDGDLFKVVLSFNTLE
jgi:signal transduction histidine kinase